MTKRLVRPAVQGFQNRVRELITVPADQLRANPLNWRVHPQSQTEAMKTALQQIGFAGALLAYKSPRSNNLTLIDGHMRLSLAKDSDKLPVLLLDVNDKEADAILASFDKIGSMASVDQYALNGLLASLTDDNSEGSAPSKELMSLIHELPENKPPEATPVTQLNDIELELRTMDVFPSKNKFGIPDIRKDMLYDVDIEDLTIRTWSGEPESDVDLYVHIMADGSFAKHRDTLAPKAVASFFTDDEYFKGFWNNPHSLVKKIIHQKYAATMSIDYSVSHQVPQAENIWAIYQSRWFDRTFQECGIKLLPAIQHGFPGCADFVWEGVPKNVPLMAIGLMATEDEIDYALILRRVKEHLRTLAPLQVLFYCNTLGLKVVEDVKPPMPYKALEGFILRRNQNVLKKGDTEHGRISRRRQGREEEEGRSEGQEGEESQERQTERPEVARPKKPVRNRKGRKSAAA